MGSSLGDISALRRVIGRLDEIFSLTQDVHLFKGCTGEGIDAIEMSVVRARTAANNELVRLGDTSLAPVEGRIIRKERFEAVSKAARGTEPVQVCEYGNDEERLT